MNVLDTLISEVDNALRTIFPPHRRIVARQSPGNDPHSPTLSAAEKKHVAGLMRVNHAGEVCAQALYQGQALTASLEHIRLQMDEAAKEEEDHLAWCEQRLTELESKPSVLNSFWYLGSFILGSVAGLAGDRFSLGFVAETEHQVAAHLRSHIQKLPAQDQKSKVILQQMLIDETQHAEAARQAGGVELPFFIKKLMQNVSRLMTQTSYYL